MSEPATRPWTLAEFLAWEREQPEKWEFDGVQPIPVTGMTGGSVPHARVASRMLTALATRLAPPCEAFGSDLKVLTAAASRSRYPDVTVVCGAGSDSSDLVEPLIVVEVLSPGTARTDRVVKVPEYQGTPSVRVIVLLAQDRPEAWVFRRSEGWRERFIEGTAAVLELPEVGVVVPLIALYG